MCRCRTITKRGSSFNNHLPGSPFLAATPTTNKKKTCLTTILAEHHPSTESQAPKPDTMQLPAHRNQRQRKQGHGGSHPHLMNMRSSGLLCALHSKRVSRRVYMSFSLHFLQPCTKKCFCCIRFDAGAQLKLLPAARFRWKAKLPQTSCRTSLSI